MIKKLLAKIFPQKVSDVVVKKVSKVPSEERIVKRQNDLMEKLFYAPVRNLCVEGADNTVSFTFKNERPFFTARGAFLFRKDINEQFILEMPKFTGGKPIVTHFLNDEMRNTEKQQFIENIAPLVEAESGETFTSLLGCETDIVNGTCTSEENPNWRKNLYWSFFARICHLNINYLYNHPDLNFCLERLARDIFTIIAIEELSDDCMKKQDLLLTKEENLVKTLAYCLHPFSLNAFSEIRNAAPKIIGQRMPTVAIKLKKISKGDYVSPYQSYRVEIQKNEL